MSAERCLLDHCIVRARRQASAVFCRMQPEENSFTFILEAYSQALMGYQNVCCNI
jgi:hypothetical protein